MSVFIEWIVANTDWLYTKIHQNAVFFIDLWSFVHVWAGIGLITLLSALGARSRFKLLLAILVSYEVVELTLILLAFHVFRPETLKDQFTDVLVGLVGGGMGAWLITMPGMSSAGWFKHEYARDFVALSTSLLMAFSWVGSYGYEYGTPFLNSDGLNWWAFLLWGSGLFLTIQFYEYLSRHFSRTVFTFIVVWTWHCAWLLIYEYVGYNLLAIREVNHNGSPPFVLDLVHGSRALHVFYLTAPLIAVGMYESLLRMYSAARSREFPEPSPSCSGD